MLGSSVAPKVKCACQSEGAILHCDLHSQRLYPQTHQHRNTHTRTHSEVCFRFHVSVPSLKKTFLIYNRHQQSRQGRTSSLPGSIHSTKPSVLACPFLFKRFPKFVGCHDNKFRLTINCPRNYCNE